MKSSKAILVALTLLFSSSVYQSTAAHEAPTRYLNAESSAKTADIPLQEGTEQKTASEDKDSEAQTATVNVTEKGFEPQSLKLKKDIPAKVTFLRQTEKTCGLKLVIPEYKIKRDLPLNEAVVVEFTPTKSGELTFTCGMGMMRGSLIVQ